MNISIFKTIAILFFLLMAVIFTTPVEACSVCFGDPSSPLTMGLQKAILLLLGILAVVFTLFIKFIIGFTKRSRALMNPDH